jgi:S1-C subfamily serine protease
LERTVPYLGIEWQLQSGTDSSGKACDVTTVRRVIADSPACKVGLREGDVIRSVDGVALCEEHTLAALITAKKPGVAVTLELVRAGKRVHTKVTLGERKLPEFKFKPIESTAQQKPVDVNR